MAYPARIKLMSLAPFAPFAPFAPPFAPFAWPLFACNLTAILVWVAHWMTKRLYQERRRDYQVKFANALSKMKHNVVRLPGLAPPPNLLERMVCAMALEVEPIRPDRSFPRDIKSTKPKRFHPNYKRCR